MAKTLSEMFDDIRLAIDDRVGDVCGDASSGLTRLSHIVRIHGVSVRYTCDATGEETITLVDTESRAIASMRNDVNKHVTILDGTLSLVAKFHEAIIE